jgi:hypothetical protein
MPQVASAPLVMASLSPKVVNYSKKKLCNIGPGKGQQVFVLTQHSKLRKAERVFTNHLKITLALALTFQHLNFVAQFNTQKWARCRTDLMVD